MQHEILLNERSHLLKQEQRVVVSTHDAYLLIWQFMLHVCLLRSFIRSRSNRMTRFKRKQKDLFHINYAVHSKANIFFQLIKITLQKVS